MFSLYGDYFQHAPPLASVLNMFSFKSYTHTYPPLCWGFLLMMSALIPQQFLPVTTCSSFDDCTIYYHAVMCWGVLRLKFVSSHSHPHLCRVPFTWILHNTVFSPHLITYVLRCFSSNDDLDSIHHPLLLCRFYSVFDSGSWPFIDSHFQAVHLHISMMDRHLPVLTSSVVHSSLLNLHPPPP